MNDMKPETAGNTPEPKYKKFFIDTEFIEAGPYLPITLLSIGIVCEDGRELYLEAEADISHANEWVRVNVFPHLTGPKLKLEAIAARIRSFVGLSTEIEFWGYYADYDWVVFAQIFGSMMDLPNGWPMYCRDLKQLCDSRGNPKLPAQSSTEHNALHDARWNKEAFDFLVAASSKEATSREHICEAELFERGPSDGYAKDGERWTCSCGKIYEHSCDEASGCQWNLCAEATPSPAKLPSCTVCGSTMISSHDIPAQFRCYSCGSTPELTVTPSPATKDSPNVEWICEDELPEGYPYDEMFSHSKLGHDGLGGVRIFPKIAAPSPAREDGVYHKFIARVREEEQTQASQGPAREETLEQTIANILKLHNYPITHNSKAMARELYDAGSRSVVVTPQPAKCMTADDFSEQWRNLKQVHAKFSTRCIDDMFASYWAEIEHLMEAYAKHCTLAGVAALPLTPNLSDEADNYRTEDCTKCGWMRGVLQETGAALQSLDLESDYYVNGQRHPSTKKQLIGCLAKIGTIFSGVPSSEETKESGK